MVKKVLFKIIPAIIGKTKPLSIEIIFFQKYNILRKVVNIGNNGDSRPDFLFDVMKKELTFDNYIAMCDRHLALDFQCGNWWPSIEDIKTKIEPKLEQNLEFLIWISETADAPVTEEQKASQRYINELLNNTLVFVDQPATAPENDESKE